MFQQLHEMYSVSPVGSFPVCLFRVSCPHPVWLSGFSCLLILSVLLSYFLSLNRFCASCLIILSVSLVLSCLIILSVSLVLSCLIILCVSLKLPVSPSSQASCLSLILELLNIFYFHPACLLQLTFPSVHIVFLVSSSCLALPSFLSLILIYLLSFLFILSVYYGLLLFLFIQCFLSPHPVWLSGFSCILNFSVSLVFIVSSSCLSLLSSCFLILSVLSPVPCL